MTRPRLCLILWRAYCTAKGVKCHWSRASADARRVIEAMADAVLREGGKKR